MKTSQKRPLGPRSNRRARNVTLRKTAFHGQSRRPHPGAMDNLGDPSRHLKARSYSLNLALLENRISLGMPGAGKLCLPPDNRIPRALETGPSGNRSGGISRFWPVPLIPPGICPPIAGCVVLKATLGGLFSRVQEKRKLVLLGKDWRRMDWRCLPGSHPCKAMSTSCRTW